MEVVSLPFAHTVPAKVSHLIALGSFFPRSCPKHCDVDMASNEAQKCILVVDETCIHEAVLRLSLRLSYHNDWRRVCRVVCAS